MTLETLWGSKVDMAIERLRSFEPAEGYWLAFSGGKDSQVVWQYHRERDLPHCSLYDEGRTRVGCVLCPMNRHRSDDIERWPRIAAAYRRACDQAFALRIANPNRETPWATAEEMWEWWLSDGPMTGDDSDQMLLFV